MGVIRLVLALAVVVAHSEPLFGLRFTGGLVAVEIFFMISGFYMSMILTTKYTGAGSYRLFLTNRALRIFPLYWVVAGATFCLSIAAGLGTGDWWRLTPYVEFGDGMGIQAIVYSILTNLSLIGQDLSLFLGLDQQGNYFFTPNFANQQPFVHEFLLVPPAWSLSLELCFYLLAPFIVHKSAKFIVVCIACSLGLRAFIYFKLGWVNDPWTYRFFPTELALFMLGILAYRWHEYLITWKISPQVFHLAYGTCIALLIGYQFLPGELVYAHVRNWLVYFAMVGVLPLVFRATKNWSWDRSIGELSYPVYIVHYLVIDLIGPIVQRLGIENLCGELAVVTSVVVSLILIKMVVKPLEGFRQSRVTKVASADTKRPNQFRLPENRKALLNS